MIETYPSATLPMLASIMVQAGSLLNTSSAATRWSSDFWPSIRWKIKPRSCNAVSIRSSILVHWLKITLFYCKQIMIEYEEISTVYLLIGLLVGLDPLSPCSLRRFSRRALTFVDGRYLGDVTSKAKSTHLAEFVLHIGHWFSAGSSSSLLVEAQLEQTT